ncbi:hypothetical protein TNCV_4296311 [Trichonephila clavipes]|nr:hypothetical protein TNCV_4296311 [Trichonephila clavipes]
MPASRGFSVVRAFPVWKGPRMQGAVRRDCSYGGERASIGGLGKNRRGLGGVAVPHHSRESTEVRVELNIRE